MMYSDELPERNMMLMGEWMGQPAPPLGLLEERVLEMESLGLLDEADEPGGLSGVRMFAIASLLHRKPPYFVTMDDRLLEFRDILESRYGMSIFSLSEALGVVQ